MPLELHEIRQAIVQAAELEHARVVRDTDEPRRRPTLRQGARGSHVLALQEALGAERTGRFDAFTLQAVRRYQAAEGLKVDGVVGRDTWTALGAYLTPGYPGDIEVITDYISGNGWQGWLDKYGDGKYTERYEDEDGEERTMKWCGHFVGAMLRRVGDELTGVDVRAPLVRFCTPSCSRLASSRKWKEAKLPEPELLDIMSAEPGDIATVGSTKNGTHIVLIVARPNPAGYVDTIEGNAWGELGDGSHGEGVVRRRRQWSEFCRVYRLGFEHFKGSGVPR